MVDLLCLKIENEDTKAETVADLLIAAHKHESQKVREVALDKIRKDRNILKHEQFRQRMKKEDPIIILDLLRDL